MSDHDCHKCHIPMDMVSQKFNVDGFNEITEYKCPKCGGGSVAMGCMG